MAANHGELGDYVGFSTDSDYVTMLKGHCLVHGCMDCSHHRRGVTMWNLTRVNPDHADARGLLAGTDVPIVLRYISYYGMPRVFAVLLHVLCF